MPTFSGGRLLPAGADKVFSSDCASATLGADDICLPPLFELVPAGGESPIGINEPSALPTAMDRLGIVGCGITSASTITLCLPTGCTGNVGESIGDLLAS